MATVVQLSKSIFVKQSEIYIYAAYTLSNTLNEVSLL